VRAENEKLTEERNELMQNMKQLELKLSALLESPTSVVDVAQVAVSNAPSTPATMANQRSTLLPQMATMSNDSIVKFRPFDNVETN